MQKKIFVFLRNKLGTIDAALPLLLELKQKYDIKSEIITFDYLTFNGINKNIFIKDSIKEIGKLIYIDSKNKVLRKLKIFLFMVKVSVRSLFEARVFHFGTLSEGPFKFFAGLFYNKLYFLDKAAFKYSGTNIYTKEMSKKPKRLIRSGKYEIHFYPHNSERKLETNVIEYYYPRARPLWVNFSKSKANFYFSKFHKELDKKKDLIVFILGGVEEGHGKVQLDIRDQFKKIIRILGEEFSHCQVLIKPHIYTDIDFVKEFISKFNNLELTYLHPTLLSTRAKIFLVQSFSSTMADAKSMGVPTVEFAKYNDKLIEATKGHSIEKEYVDFFIQNDEKLLIKTLSGILLSKKIVVKNTEIEGLNLSFQDNFFG